MRRKTFLCSLLLAISATTACAQSFKIEPTYDAAQVRFTIDNRAISAQNIADYQHGTSITADDVVIGQRSVAIRLGRENDMLMISAFRRSKDVICVQHMYMRIRDGHNIKIEHLGAQGGNELYGVTYGRRGDLYNSMGIRDSDFEFVFDPRAPRTGRDRNPTTKVRDFENNPEIDVVRERCG